MRLLLLLLTCLTTTVHGDYSRPSHVPREEWARARPFFFPYDHPTRRTLDAIFSKERVLLNIKTMRRAGFINPHPQKSTRLIVTTHPLLKGYIVKSYLDAQRPHNNSTESFFWIKRATGARAIQAMLDQRGWNSTFKVPKKWIYPLPPRPAPPKSFRRINFILIEEDMELTDEATNKTWWKSDAVTGATLCQLHAILQRIGLNDCCKIDNIPFARDGRIAFVDTQSHHQWPVPFKKLTHGLGPRQRTLWHSIYKHKKSLTKEGLPLFFR